ncbi:MAG: DUF4230 domain-containing protein [Aerococcaceae bacterium]|nr:DUF4230 domain-containing protein [Aerococcaceae bacterium]
MFAKIMSFIKKIFSVKWLRRVALLLIAALGVIIWFNLGTAKPAEPTITADLVGNRLENAQDLITQKYYYTNTGAFEHQNEFYGWKLPFTRKNFILAYDGVVHAGIDLKEVKIEIKGKNIEITLPKAKILAHEMDSESIKVFDENTSFFNPIQLEDFQKFMASQEKVVEQKAIDRKFLELADEAAERVITGLIDTQEGIFKDYKVIFVK